MPYSARDSILNSLRKSLNRKTSKPADDPVGFNDNSITNTDEVTGEAMSGLTGQFCHELDKVKGEFIKCSTNDELTVSLLDIVQEYNFGTVAVAGLKLLEEENFVTLLRGRGITVLEPGNPKGLEAADAGITEAQYAISESGTVVQISSKENPRSFSLLPPVHICLLNAQKILPDIHNFFSTLKNDHPDLTHSSACMTFITGPSRTADIELNLTLGVHGPARLIIVLLE